MSPETTMDRAAVYALFATESDRESMRRMQALPAVIAMVPICLLAWSRAIAALVELLGVL